MKQLLYQQIFTTFLQSPDRVSFDYGIVFMRDAYDQDSENNGEISFPFPFVNFILFS